MSRHESDTESDNDSDTDSDTDSDMSTRLGSGPDGGRTGLGADAEPADEHPGEALARLPDGRCVCVCVCVCVCDREI